MLYVLMGLVASNIAGIVISCCETLRHCPWRSMSINYFVYQHVCIYNIYHSILILILMQGCGLGLEVSVSRQSRELTTSRLGLGRKGLVHIPVLMSTV